MNRFAAAFKILFKGETTWPPGPGDDFWYGGVNYKTSSGATVTPDTAMRLTVVFRCVTLLSETPASLPLLVYRQFPNGDKERAPDHPLYRVLHDQPNEFQTSFEWRTMMGAHVELRGNGYSEILKGRRGFVDQLVPLHPDRVTIKRIKNSRRIFYEYRTEEGLTRELAQEQVLHFKGLTLDGYAGVSPITYCREAVGMGLSAEEYGARFFQNDAKPGFFLKTPQTLGPEKRREFREAWQKEYTAGGRHKIAVLEAGMEPAELGMSNRDAQFIESRKFSNEDVARMFGVQPHLVGILERSTNNNIEHQGIEAVIYTFRTRTVRQEQRINTSLIPEGDPHFAEHLLDGLMRGDIKSRYDAYWIGKQGGWLSSNEIRAFENMNRVEGGDTYWAPVNMVPAEQLGMQQATDDTDAVAKQAKFLAEAAIERSIRKEVGVLRKMLEKYGAASDFAAAARDFYRDHLRFMTQALPILPVQAWEFLGPRQEALLRASEAADWKVAVESTLLAWESRGARDCVALSFGGLKWKSAISAS